MALFFYFSKVGRKNWPTFGQMAVQVIKMQTGPPASSETKVKLYTPSSHNRNALSFFVRKKQKFPTCWRVE
jgi:hypothetical protein